MDALFPSTKSTESIEAAALALGVPRVRLLRSSRRTLALELKTDLTLLIRTPKFLNDSKICLFLQKNKRWVERTLKRLKSLEQTVPRRFEDGETFLFLGKTYPLRLVNTPDSAALELKENQFCLSAAGKRLASFYFESWYREQAQIYFADRVQFFSERFGFERRGIRLSNAKTRWGSCSSKRDLNFSWRLVMAPREVIDYVVVHELTHCEFFNHSPKFWNRVSKICPDYPSMKRWLREKGHLLTL